MSTSRAGRQRRFSKQPLDRVAPAAMLLLAVVIAAMLLLGTRALPSVRTFSWEGKQIAADDVAFMMTFTQPLDPQSVEQNLRITPSLAGKFSWAGRRMAYTLEAPAPYGQSYEVSLPAARLLNGQAGFDPFDSEFHTRDRVFAYIGAEGKEKGRLILFNLTRKEKTLLTPEDQAVLDFRPYPERDRIAYLSASNQADEQNLLLPELYTVSTGLEETNAEKSSPAMNAPTPRWQFWRQASPVAAGTIQQILDNKAYQNLKFDLSPDGNVIVIQRVNRDNPADFGPWVLMNNQPAYKLKTEPGGDFKIAPDSLSLLLQQGEGTAVIALDPELSEVETETLVDFLPDYGLTLDIANDGSAAALVNFNQDDPDKQFTQSLFWVSNRGDEKPLLNTDGEILSARFNEDNEILYVLINQRLPGETYQVAPYLTAINVTTGKEQRLLEMPPQPDIRISLSPDDLAILFDEALVSNSGALEKDDDTDEASAGATHRLWLLPLFSTLDERLNGEPVALPPTELEISGRYPVWLP
ncbi:MAG: hypothetical protein WBC73_21240 [Phormidesmis sp.]